MKEFVHRPYVPGDTIAAIATPPGEGGIAIIRISGHQALDIAEKVFSGPIKTYHSHTAHFGFVKDGKGRRIDEALAIVMLGHRSYTGEDTVELQCHGGMVASKNILGAVFEAGARPAAPGEFTLKAFMNGKLDLTQAEAVQQLIGAKNEKAFELAGRHLEGRLSKKIIEFQQKIISVTAILEAWVDFPEEGIEFTSVENICFELQIIIDELKKLIDSFHTGERIHHGISLCIVGCPNAGKSSLMNAMLDRQRAIVTPIPGTTRDVLEEDFLLGGLHFRLMDTAGIRESAEVVEKEGIHRSYQAMKSADLILFILDVSKGFGKEEEILFSKLPLEKTILVWNKIDLPHSPQPTLQCPYNVHLSAKEKLGLERLYEQIEQIAWSGGTPAKDEIILTSQRHFEAILLAQKSLMRVVEGLLQERSPEFLTFDARQALFELGTVIGTNITEEILSSIFSQFCIGK